VYDCASIASDACRELLGSQVSKQLIAWTVEQKLKENSSGGPAFLALRNVSSEDSKCYLVTPSERQEKIKFLELN
jgi:hypothetical protein